MNKYSKLLFFILFFISINAKAQNTNFISDKVFVGSNFSFFLGTISLIELSPHIGYKILPPLSVAIGGNYMFYNDSRYNPNLRTDLYGYKAFVRYDIFEKYFAQIEYNNLYVKKDVLNFNPLQSQEGRVWSEGLFVGGGYQAKMNERLSSYIYIGINLNDNLYSPYQNPKIDIGIEYQF
jgi:hypothetical protein